MSHPEAREVGRTVALLGELLPRNTGPTALAELCLPLADLAPIVRASSQHDAIARELAEARRTFAIETAQLQPHESIERQSLPSFDTIVSRVSTRSNGIVERCWRRWA